MKLWRKLWSIFLRPQMDEDLDEEMRLHIELRSKRLRESGMDACEAEVAARRLFGNTTQLREASREAWSWPRFDEILQDIRYALRGFRRSPGFVAAVVGTIGLGLGVNAAVFTVFNAYVLRPFPVRDSASLYEVGSVTNSWGGFSWNEYLEFPKEHPFREFFGYTFIQPRMDGREVRGQLVTGNFFQMLGVNPYLGRLLEHSDSATRNEGAFVVLSHEIWQSRYGSAADLIGKDVTVNGQRLQVVGIATPGFLGVGQTLVDLWIPMTMAPLVTNGPDMFGPSQPRSLRIVGRLVSGVDPAAAKRNITSWAQRLPPTATNPSIASISMVPRTTFVSFKVEMLAILTPVFVAFFLVLLIACANVANLLLSRSISRQREIGIRLSLGAGRPRVIRQLLTESVLLALSAAVVGVAISHVAIRLALRWLAVVMPPRYSDAITLMPFTPDARVFASMIFAAIVSAIVFGLFPAIQATNGSIVQTARGDFGTDYRPSRLRNVLIGIQVTISIVLLICAGILLRGAQSLRQIDPGMDIRNVLVVQIQDRARTAYLSYLQSNGAIEMMAGANTVPMMGGGVPVASVTAVESQRAFVTSFLNVSPEYFRIFKIPTSRGRNFAPEEAFSKADVAIVSKAAADTFWPGADPIGRSLRISKGTSYREVQVVGIASDVIGALVGASAGIGKRMIYTPSDMNFRGNDLVLRIRGNQEDVRRDLDRELERVFPGGVVSIQPMTEVFSTLMFPFTVIYATALAVGVLALWLTVSGVYGVVSFVVSQRTKEIGIRIALGASAARVKYLVVSQVAGAAIHATILGVALAAAFSMLLASRVVVMKTFDVIGYSAAILVVLFACGLAAFLPSRRASSVDPASTLKSE